MCLGLPRQWTRHPDCGNLQFYRHPNDPNCRCRHDMGSWLPCVSSMWALYRCRWTVWHATRCSPHSTIETREARSDPQGILSVHGDKKYTKQGNLHPTQTAILLSRAFARFAVTSGPSLSVGDMGSKAQAELIFGYDQINTINTTRGAFTITPLQNHAIADTYSRILQSITKVRMNFLEIQVSVVLIRFKIYLSGKLGTAYVPGRLSKPALVFRSSMSNLLSYFALRFVITCWCFHSLYRGFICTLCFAHYVYTLGPFPCWKGRAIHAG